MILIFGGAYQGKLDYVKANYKCETVCDCSKGREPDFDADVIYGIEGFVMECAKASVSAKAYFEERESLWENKILVMTDTSQGVVPIDKTVREFREMNGRLMMYLAGKADSVVRVFCGIGKEIKARQK